MRRATRYATVHAARPRLGRVASAWGPGGKLPCASGTYITQEAGTRRPYVPYGGPGAHVSACAVTVGLPVRAYEKPLSRYCSIDSAGAGAA